MTALTVEVVEVRPASDDGPDGPTIIGTVVHGPGSGTVVQAACDPAEARAMLDELSELGAMPPVAVVEPWQIVAAGLRTCDGCGAVEDAGTGPDLDAMGYGPCCTGEVQS